MPSSSWLISEFTPQGEDFFVGVGPVTVTMPEVPLYLHDPTAALSFLDAFRVELENATGNPGDIVVTLQRNRLVRIDIPGLDAIDWGAATDIRDALGFAGNLASAASHTATLVSPYLWCPGMTEISDMRLGRTGIPVYDVQSGGGGGFVKPIKTRSQYRVNATLEWRHVANSRVWTTSEPDALVGGEHYAFWHTVMLPGLQFCHYRGLNNDEASTTSVGLSAGSRVGPYAWAPKSGDQEYPYDRSIAHVEHRNNIKIPVTQVSELS